MKTNNKLNKIRSKAKDVCVWIVIGLVIGCIVGWSTHTAIYNITHKEPEVSVGYVTGKLENIGELATQKLTYSGKVPLEEGSIPFITKKGFVMEYNATIKVGIDVEAIKVDIKNDKVIVSVPHTKLLDTPHVDPSSIKYFDEKKAIFNWITKEDVAKAIEEAENDIAENEAIDLQGLFANGDENLETLIHNLLDDVVGDKEVEVKFMD